MKAWTWVGVLALTLGLLGLQAQAGLFGIVKMSDGGILEVDMATGGISEFQAPFRTADDSAGSAVVGPNGNLFITDRGLNDFVEYALAGAVVGTVDTGFGYNYHLIAAPDGFAYISDAGQGAYDQYIQVDYSTGKTGLIRRPVDVYGGGVRQSTIANDGLFWITKPDENTIKVYDFVGDVEVANYDGILPGSPGSALGRITTRRSDGHIFGWQENTKVLLELDPTTPGVGPLQQYDLSGFTWRSNQTVQFGPDGNLYVIDTQWGAGRTSNLHGFSLNAGDGTATEVFNVNLGADKLAWFDVAFIPEPGTLALLLVGVGSLQFWRRKK